ncbi:MAG: hypothetical protein KJI69_05025 [Patescibacteria group bacterium]|nr:hypothetical protein [Patescibacteria group bacterium]
MKFKEKVLKYLDDKTIIVSKVEQEGDTESIVCHIHESDRQLIHSFRLDMEKELNVYVAVSDMFGMSVLIVESKDIE